MLAGDRDNRPHEGELIEAVISRAVSYPQLRGSRLEHGQSASHNCDARAVQDKGAGDAKADAGAAAGDEGDLWSR